MPTMNEPAIALPASLPTTLRVYNTLTKTNQSLETVKELVEALRAKAGKEGK